MLDRNHCYDKKFPHKITIPRSKVFLGIEKYNVDKVRKNSESVIGKNSEGLMGEKF